MANPWDDDPVVGGKTSSPAEFTQAYGPAAERAAKTLGVDPKVLLGQWGLETGWGKSIIPGTNNLGNIKDFAGGGVGATDNMTGSKDKYRAYDSPEAFADDYASLIQRKYPNAIGAKDPQAFATALKAGGYAEDPRYVDKVAQAARMAGSTPNPVVAAVGNAVSAVIPSAQAATGNPWDNDPVVEAPASSAAPEGGGAAFGVYPSARRKAQNNTPNASDAIIMGGARGVKDVIDTGAQLLSRAAGPEEAARVQAMNDQGKADFKDQYGGSSLASAARVGGNVVATAPVGGILGAPLKAVAPFVSRAAPAVGNVLSKLGAAAESGGMTVGGTPATTVAGTAGNMLARAAGGAATGAASAGLVNPDDAGTGAAFGAALPFATKVLGATGNAIGRSLSGGALSPEVKALAGRAKDLGIDIPADRLVNSKPLNALASSLEYAPLSGRAATMNKMEDQMNQAVSRTFGQDSPNVTQALRKANEDLGGKFDKVLQNNTVKVDQRFMDDLAEASNQASRELGSDGAGIISKQVDDILSKAGNGEIDGQAAYNIKKTLDRISQRNTPEAFYARDLKQKLMDALNRSLGPEEAAAFAGVRQQYGNMLSMEKLAQNGAEGGVSIARLANMKNINNPQLQELADISAQFLKGREGMHGAAQRTIAGLGIGGAVGIPALAGTIALGRGANTLLNSGAVKNAILGESTNNRLLQLAQNPDVQKLMYRSAPVIGSQ